MGHTSTIQKLNATNERDALTEGKLFAEEFARENVDRGENPLGLYNSSSFRFYDRIFDTTDDFYDFMSDGFYKDGVARVRRAPAKVHDKLRNSRERAQKMRSDATAALHESVKSRKSKTITCKECESRYDKKWLLKRALRCPVCGKQFTNAAYEAKQERASEIERQAFEEFRRASAASTEFDYWVKVEVHC